MGRIKLHISDENIFSKIKKILLKQNNLDLSNYLVILPTTFSCGQFRSTLLEKNIILPQIHTINSFVERNITKLGYNYSGMDEFINLYKLIMKDKAFEGVSNKAEVLGEVLDLINKKNLLKADLKRDKFIHEYPEHFEILIDRLFFIEKENESFLESVGKISLSKARALLFEEFNKFNLIVAGVNCDKEFLDFARKRIESAKILTIEEELVEFEDSKGNIDLIIKKSGLDFSNKAVQFYLEGLNLNIPLAQNNINIDNILFIEFERIYQECLYIVEKIRDKPTAKFGLLIKDEKYFNLIKKLLNNSDIKFNFESKITTSQTNFGKYFLQLIDFIIKPDAIKFLDLIKKVEIDLKEVYSIEYELRKRFFLDESDFTRFLKKINDKNLENYENKICISFIKKLFHLSNSNHEVPILIEKALDLAKNYFSFESNDKKIYLKLLKFTSELQYQKDLNSIDSLVLIRNLINNLSFSSFYDPKYRVSIYDSLASLSISDDDEIFILDFDDDSYLREYSNIFLPNSIADNLMFNHKKYENLYYFLSLLNRKITLTKARNSIKTYRYLDSLTIKKSSKKDQIVSKKSDTKQLSIKESISINTTEKIKIFYATYLEKLVNDPFTFYVEKILNLSITNQLNEIPSYKEFGIIVHKCLELMHKESLDEVFQNYPKYLSRAWKAKILNVVKLVQQHFHYEHTSESEHLISVRIQIKDELFELKAIVDKIVKDNERVVLIDYKTGVAPTLKQIKDFKSIQLLVSSFIYIVSASESIEKFNNDETDIEIIYRLWHSFDKKIQIQYLKLSPININKIDLDIDYEIFKSFSLFIINRLNFYIKNDISDIHNHQKYADLLQR